MLRTASFRILALVGAAAISTALSAQAPREAVLENGMAAAAIESTSQRVAMGEWRLPDSATRNRDLPTRPEWPRQAPPSKLALYVGLDFYGADIGSLEVTDLAECARACIAEPSGLCSAFTFNTRPSNGFDNCFMKTDGGVPDANAVAISGRLLQADARPPRLGLGAIPPQELMRNIDLPGGDLSRLPSGHGTLSSCRLACVQNSRCQAFTFVEARRDCWMKGNGFGMRTAQGMISGVKTQIDITPDRVITLD